MKRIIALWVAVVAMQAHAHAPKLIEPGSTPPTPFPGHDTLLLSDHDSTPSGVAVLELTLAPRTFGAPPHVHEREDEHFFVIEGEVEFLDRERTLSASAGSLVVLPRGHLHGFWNLGNSPARMLMVVSPGEFASFFDAVVARVRAENPDNPEAVGAIIGRVAAQYQVTIHPDKVPASARPVLPR